MDNYVTNCVLSVERTWMVQKRTLGKNKIKSFGINKKEFTLGAKNLANESYVAT